MAADLFGERPLVQRGNVLVDYFHDRFVSERGFKPLGMGRLAKILKEQEVAWGRSAVFQVIDRFFSSSHPRIVNSDYGVATYQQMAQWLMMGEDQPTGRSAENAREVRKATGR